MNLLFYTLFSLGLCAVLLVVFSRTAKSIGLTDKPNTRKKHNGEVPLVGGISLFTGSAMVLLFSQPNEIEITILCVAFFALLLGVFDDLWDLDAKLRLIVQVGIALLLTMVFSIRISSLGDVLGLGDVVFNPIYSILFTTFCLVGVLNALNMSDGVDGLVGLLVLITLIAIAYLCWQSGRTNELRIFFVLVGGLIPFLLFNLGFFGDSRKVFLGDGGSMMLGVILAVLFIYLSQLEEPVFKPATAGWLLGLPLLDSVVVMIRRIVRGQSPLHAGRDHFHHVLIDAGMNAKATLLLLVAIHSVLVGVGLLSHLTTISESNYFWTFVGISLLHFMLTPSITRALIRNEV